MERNLHCHFNIKIIFISFPFSRTWKSLPKLNGKCSVIKTAFGSVIQALPFVTLSLLPYLLLCVTDSTVDANSPSLLMARFRIWFYLDLFIARLHATEKLIKWHNSETFTSVDRATLSRLITISWGSLATQRLLGRFSPIKYQNKVASLSLKIFVKSGIFIKHS